MTAQRLTMRQIREVLHGRLCPRAKISGKRRNCARFQGSIKQSDNEFSGKSRENSGDNGHGFLQTDPLCCLDSV